VKKVVILLTYSKTENNFGTRKQYCQYCQHISERTQNTNDLK